MAFIKTDPSQKNTVIVLLVILVGAIVVTIVRINPAPRPAVAQASPAAASAVVRGADEEETALSRNPFEAPPVLQEDAVDDEAMEAEHSAGIKMTAPAAVNPWSPGEGGPDIQVPFMPGLQITDSTGAPPDPSVQKPKPQFTLIATIGSADGLSGVIESGDGEVTVVEVGDTLEEGFTVTKINSTHAILTDGRDTIIAKTPRP